MHARSAALAGLVALALALAPPVRATAQQVPVPITGADPQLTGQLDGALTQAPPDTCLRVEVGDVVLYDHRGDDLQVPASTEKLLTGSAVLDRLGADRTLRTELVTSAPIVDGVVQGDVVLVGGGDPVLTTSIYRSYRNQPEAQPTTSLDAIADQLLGRGVREVRGRVLVDDGRYDAERTVPSWPDRYIAQGQSGPLGALVIDDGLQLQLTEEGVDLVRAADPALAAGDALAGLLATRGIVVSAAGAARGERPEGATVLGGTDSPPVRTLVADLLRRSDNQMAELLLKELGVAAEGVGSTAAGARAVAGWAAGAGVAAPGSVVVDGSGLDPGNQTSCAALVAVLDAAGPSSALAEGLPVAGESGTLARRFAGTEAIGHLRAKTGSLGDVSALAGFVELPEGETATFAFIANGDLATVRTAEDLVGQLLASWRAPCAATSPAPLVAPLLAPSLALAATPGALLAAASPGLSASVAALEDPATAPLDRCAREDGTTVELGIG